MAARGFTVDSLTAGGRWGHPGRLPTPAARRAAPTGGNWNKGVISYDDKELPFKGMDATSQLVHKTGFIGAKLIDNEAAQKLENAVGKALDQYITDIRTAYTYPNPEGGDSICGLDLFSPGEIQPIARGYLTVKAATRDLIDVRADQASIEAPFEVLSAEFTEGGSSDWGDGKCFPRSATRACLCCTVFSVLLGVSALAIAGVYYAWGGRNYGDEANHGLSPGDAGYTALPIFWDGNFWGWPKEKVFRNIWCGLMLGIVFGFLDNFGLFYGTSALDATFYSIGNKIASGLLAGTSDGQKRAGYKNSEQEKDMREVALTAHKITEDMMAGLGNTFSDLLGVALGTAALEIAKAGLGVEPSWWPADLLAIVLGCLLGVFLPVLVKYKDAVAKDGLAYKYWLALFCIGGIFASVLVVGVPDDRQADFPWTIGVSLGFIIFILAFLIIFILLIPLISARSLLLEQQWAILQTEIEARNDDWYKKHRQRAANAQRSWGMLRAGVTLDRKRGQYIGLA